MGTDAADTRGTGWMDILVIHLDYEHARLYRNLRNGSFEDSTFAAKLGYATWNYSGFGTRFIDYDNDGSRDIVIANGHILDNIRLYHAGTAYAEPKLVFKNDGRGVFENVSGRLGPNIEAPRVSRGLAAADFDNDGGNRNHWLEIHLSGVRSNRDGVGARVKVVAGGLVSYDEVKGGMSYQSAQDLRLHFGLGARARVDSIEVRWPSGIVDRIADIASDRTIAVKEGAGIVDRPSPRK